MTGTNLPTVDNQDNQDNKVDSADPSEVDNGSAIAVVDTLAAMHAVLVSVHRFTAYREEQQRRLVDNELAAAAANIALLRAQL